MASASISGLASGLDTASIISQLLQIEAAPQTRLKSQLSTQQSGVKLLQDLNAKLAALSTEAGKLADPASWSAVSATTSDDQVSVVGTSGASPVDLALSVTSLAKSHQVAYGAAALTDVVAGTSVTVNFADPTVPDTTVTLATGTLRELAAALNAAGTGVRATTVDVGGGQHQLLVTSAATGAVSRFTATNADGSPLALGAGTVVTQGQDAELTVGGIPVTSASNTVTAVSGLSITLGAALGVPASVDVSVAVDTGSLKTAVKSLVTSVNAALTSIDSLSTYNATTKTSGPLYGDSALRSARSALAGSIYPADGTSLASVGIQVDRNGKLTFDEVAFDTAYAADPAAVRDAFADATSTGGTSTSGAGGFATRIEAVGDRLSDSLDGTVTTAIKSHTDTLDQMQDGIEDWNRRLALRRIGLERQFAALETALSQMQAQSSWLAGQLGSLSTSGA